MSDAACRPDADAVRAAAVRLRGHLVATPLIGGLLLPGFAHAADVRIKPELLQPGGSVWFRGHLHFLLRSMGRPVGLTWAEGRGTVVSVAAAAAACRVPLRVFVRAPLDARQAAAVAHLGAEVSCVEDPVGASSALGRRDGFTVLPGEEHPDVAAGLATLGLELAAAMPWDAAVVHVAPGLGAAVAAGLAAGGHGAVVVEATSASGTDALGASLLAHHGMRAGAGSLAALAAALGREGAGCTVSVLEY